MTAADALAQAVSIVLSPLLMPAYVMLLVLLDLGSGVTEIVSTLVVVLLLLCAVPLIDILWMIRRGRTVTLDIPNRSARTEAFAVAIVAGSLAIILVRWLGFRGEPLVHVILVAFVINTIVTMGINLLWKISVHMVALSGSIAILLVAGNLSGDSSPVLREATIIPLLVFVGTVGWARLRLKAHTLAQVVVGTVLGFCGHWFAMLAQVSALP